MNTTIFFEFISPAQAIMRMKAWIPELVVKDRDNKDILLVGYSNNYSLIQLPALPRTRTKSKDTDDPDVAVQLPNGHIIEEPYALTALTPEAEAVLEPLHRELYEECLEKGRWVTKNIETGIRQLPMHTVQMAGEVVPDERKGWQLLAEEVDDPREPTVTKASLVGKKLSRDGVELEITANSVKLNGRKGRKEITNRVNLDV